MTHNLWTQLDPVTCPQIMDLKRDKRHRRRVIWKYRQSLWRNNNSMADCLNKSFSNNEWSSTTLKATQGILIILKCVWIQIPRILQTVLCQIQTSQQAEVTMMAVQTLRDLPLTKTSVRRVSKSKNNQFKLRHSNAKTVSAHKKCFTSLNNLLMLKTTSQTKSLYSPICKSRNLNVPLFVSLISCLENTEKGPSLAALEVHIHLRTTLMCFLNKT